MKKLIAIIVIILVVLGVFVAVDNAKTPTTEGLKIGVISSLSGDFAAVGENFVKGIKTAELVYEKKTGNEIDVLVENDGGDAVKGLAAFRKLNESDHVEGLLNFFTTTMDSIYDISKEANYPVMMEAFQANNVADDHVFQMTPGNEGTWTAYAKFIKAQGFDDSKVVVVNSKDAAQESFKDAFVSAYDGSTTVYTASSDKNGLRADAASIAAMNPTMIVFIMTPENGAILTKEILPLIPAKTQLIYDVQLYTGLSLYHQHLGGDLSKINGAINIVLEGESNEEFLNAYHELYPGEEPGFLADFAYDTLLVYLDAYDPDETKWTENLKETDFRGASGHVKFDEKGIRLPDLVVKKVVDGKLEKIDRLDI